MNDPRWAAQPAATARALLAECCVDPGFVELDRERVLARGWQLVGHADAVAGRGDHVVAEVAGVPLLLVRGDDGRLRALHNVCRHRAGPLAACDGRGAHALTCRYHGWTYALDGALRGAPGMRDAADFDLGAIRLPQARVAEWLGLVWAAIDGSAGPFEALVAGIAGRAAACGVTAAGVAGWTPAGRAHYDIACNWKVYVDNYLEGYHVPHVHPALNRMLDYRSYVTEASEWYSFQWSPLESGEGLYGSGDALYYWLWPNTMLNILPGRLQTNRIVPLGVDRCRVEFDFYYTRDDSEAGEARRQADRDFSDEVQLEDLTICEDVQRGLASGSYRAGRLNPLRENAVHHFHERMRRAYRDAAATA